MFRRTKTSSDAHAPAGSENPNPISGVHFVNQSSMVPPFPDGSETISFGMGCFWGAERIFWQIPGVITTAAGYQGGGPPNPSYQEVCTGRTGHAEVALVVYDPERVSVDVLLKHFLGAARSHNLESAGQRRRYAVPVRCVLDDRGAA